MINPMRLRAAVLTLTTAVALIGCSDPAETEQPLVLCASVKASNLHVRFSPALGPGTYILLLETTGKTGTCEATLSDSSPPSSETCSGDLDVEFSEDGFGLFEAPAEVALRLEHPESGAVIEETLVPAYEEANPEVAEECPHPYAELTVEPVGMPPPTRG